MTPDQIRRMRSYIAALLRHGHLRGWVKVEGMFLNNAV